MGIFTDDGSPIKTGCKLFSPSYKQKVANDFKLAKDMANYYDMFYAPDPERTSKIEENFDIHSGRWANLSKVQTGHIFSVGNENFQLSGGELVHMPVIDTITKSIVGDIIGTPLTATVKDRSSKGRNYRDRIIIEKLQNVFNKKYIEPKIMESQQKYMAQLGKMYPSLLTPEEAQQMQQTVDKQVQDETPEEIMDIFSKTRTPEETISQIAFDDAVASHDIKNKIDIGGEYAVVTAEEYYKVGIRLNEPTFDVLNPKYVTWIGSEGIENCQDGVMAKYERYLKPEDVIQLYGNKLKKANIKTLEKYYTNSVGGSSSRVIEDPDGRQYLTGSAAVLADQMEDISNINSINFMNRDGQDTLKEMYQATSTHSRNGIGIRECYITWKWIRKMKRITRVENAVKTTIIRDEHYVFNPLLGDIKEEDMVAPQVWHATILGNPADAFYVNVEPIPFQYTNMDNPFDVKLTIYGGRYNTFQENAKNSSFVYLGKPWNFKLDLKLKSMEEKEADDLGTLLHTTAASKPVGWSWEEWYASMKTSKVIVSSSHFEGANQNDLNAIRAINLSRTNDIKGDISLLDYYENCIYKAMYYNKSKLGQLGQYTTNQNVQMASQGADRQMAKFHNKHRDIVQQALSRFLDNVLIAYRDNEHKKSILFDDFSRAYLENILDPFPIGQMSLYLVNDFEEKSKVDQLRQLALSMLQNGGSISDIAQIFSANSIAEIQDILEKSERKRSKQAEEDHARQMELAQQQQKASMDAIKQKMDYDAAENEKDRINKKEMAEIGSMQLANANDINKDGINDSMDKALIESELAKQKMEADAKIAQDKLNHDKESMRLEEKKQKQEYELALEELRIKELIAKKGLKSK